MLDYWVSTVERVGLVLDDGAIVELRNWSETPALNFLVKKEELQPYEGRVAAMWHTHPRNNVNLSATDYRMYLEKPEWPQFIVTEKRVRRFVCRKGRVFLDEADCL